MYSPPKSLTKYLKDVYKGQLVFVLLCLLFSVSFRPVCRQRASRQLLWLLKRAQTQEHCSCIPTGKTRGLQTLKVRLFLHLCPSAIFPYQASIRINYLLVIPCKTIFFPYMFASYSQIRILSRLTKIKMILEQSVINNQRPCNQFKLAYVI